MVNREQRRKTYLVNRSLQYRFLAMIIIYGLIIVLFLAVTLFVPDIVRLQDEGLSLNERAIAADKILTLHGRVWPAVIAIVCILAIHSFRSFHRLFGPLYRFRAIFEQVGTGDLTIRVKIRETDFLHQEEDALKWMVETLAEKMNQMQQASADALKSLGRLEQTVADRPNGQESAGQSLRCHRRHVEPVGDMAQYFRVG